MPSERHYYGIAAGSGLLGVVGLGATSLTYDHAASVAAADAEGLVSAFAFFFLVLNIGSTLLALGTAGLLAAVTRWATLDRVAQRVLAVGTATAGLAMVPMSVAALGWGENSVAHVPLGAWWLLGWFGAFAVGLAALVAAIGPLRGQDGLVVQGALGLVAAAVAAIGVTEAVASPLFLGVGAVGPVLGALGAFCVVFGGLVHVLRVVVDEKGRTVGWGLLAVVMVGLGAAVVTFAGGDQFAGSVLVCASLLGVWSTWVAFLAPGAATDSPTGAAGAG